MPRPRSISDLSFRTKMLLTVTAVVVALLAISLGLVSQRFTRQIHDNAAEQLRTAEGVLRIRQQTRTKELSLRFNSARNEPRFRAATGMFNGQRELLDPAKLNTFKGVAEDMVREGVADMIALTPAPGLGHSIVVARDTQFAAEDFDSKYADSIKPAFANRSQVDTVENNGRLFDMVTIPLNFEDHIVAAITFGVEDSTAEEFGKMMRKEDDLVLLLNGQVVATTLPGTIPAAWQSKAYARVVEQSQSSGDVQEIVLGEEPFWALAGNLDDPDQLHAPGYLVLSSYETPLLLLRSTQEAIVITGLLTILCGIAVVWFLVRKITEPLNELQDSAEAVGRGDFSRRVNINSRDEFGELARAFNQMTDNIELSQSKLKQAVETIKTTQAQLIQKEKLSAVGEFVAGVAHELNNPLATVMGFSEMLKDARVDEKQRRHLDIIFKSAQRCQKIVQSLLSFARQQPSERRLVGVNKLIDDVLEVVAYPLRTSNVKVITQFAPDLPPVLADGHQIQQVVLNIINNARQAIESHQPSGRITITTKTDGQTVGIILQDDGPGISPENLERIFNPFFTTKEVGKGTGLGLSLCYGIIKEHGGSIIPASAPGQGATFTIELPAVQGAAGLVEPPPIVNGDERASSNEGAGKKVLIVDDEEHILQMVREELGRHHYQTATATSGETALRRLREETFDVILCDLKMPGLNGRQVYEQLRVEHPEICRRLVFVTGDVVNESLREFLEVEKRPCLAKPFRLAELCQIVRSVTANS